MWEMRITLGGAGNVGQSFQIIVAQTTPQASQSIGGTISEWCRTQNFPGMAALPPGATELRRITVRRSTEPWGRAPDVTNTVLPGEVSVANLTDGASVPQSLEISGAYRLTASAGIWVIVFPPNGRWYPQSADACAGVHTQASGGQWRVPVNFGGPQDVGKPFDIAVVLADAEASAFLDATQRAWCAAGDAPGLLTIELPPGIVQKQQLRVYRQP
jgi:hypothetical protein